MISENIYTSLQNDEEFVNLFFLAKDADATQKSLLRQSLYKRFENEYRKLQMLDVMQIHFILPNNETLLRMHKPDKYGDSLSKVRYGVKSANKLSMHINGFEGGKTSHGFREIYPLYKNGVHIGIVEIAFSSTVIQSYTMRASGIHTHFIVNKDIFNMKEWDGDRNYNYFQSMEHSNFLFSMSHHINQDRMENTKKTVIDPSRAEIDTKIKTGKSFAVYRQLKDEVMLVCFLPIRNIKNDKVAAYLVSYTLSKKLFRIIKYHNFVLYISGIILLLIAVFMYKASIRNKNLQDELKFDALTKVFTRKYFMSLAQTNLENSLALGNKICVVMVDIDLFKLVNDTYGHQTGDVVLQEISQILKSTIREVDFVGRYGGEEFVALINANAEDTKKIVENIRKKIENYSFAKEKSLCVTASFGIAQSETSLSLENMIQQADTALYESKNNGRNRVSVF